MPEGERAMYSEIEFIMKKGHMETHPRTDIQTRVKTLPSHNFVFLDLFNYFKRNSSSLFQTKLDWLVSPAKPCFDFKSKPLILKSKVINVLSTSTKS